MNNQKGANKANTTVNLQLGNSLIFITLLMPFAGMASLPFMENKYQYPILGISTVFMTVGLAFIYQLLNKQKHLNSKFEDIKTQNDEIIKASHAFIVDMAVELRRPLHGIIGTKELFDISTLQEEERSYFEIIDFCSTYMQKQLERIQFFSESESHQSTFQNEHAVLKELINNAINDVTPFKENKEIKITSQIEDSVPLAIEGKIDILKTVLHEVLENAVKYTHKGHVDIKVQMQEDSDDVVLFNIKDSGPGISDNQKEMLFKAFNNSDTNVPWSERGSGLGLSIAKSLCKRISSDIWVESDRKHGSSFYFTFPINEPIAKKVIINKERLVSSVQNAKPTLFEDNISSPHHVSFAKILIVDDEHFARKVIKNMLKKMGYFCDVAKDGEEALNKVKAKDYDLILMDIQMPVMDGWEACQRILKVSNTHLPKIVALTSHTRPVDKKMCEETGMKGFISKPIKKEELNNLLDELNIRPDFTPGQEPIEKEFKTLSHIKTNSGTNVEIDFNKLYLYFDKNFDKCKSVLMRAQRSIINCSEKLGSSFENEDYKEMQFQAHHLKGNLAYLMCEHGEELCINIESELKKADMDLNNLSEYYIKLQEYTYKIVFEISSFLEQIENSNDEKSA